MDVWRQAGKFEGRSAVTAWRLRVSRPSRRCSVGKTSNWKTRLTQAIEDTSDDPEVTATKKDTSEALRKCLGGLSQEHPETVDRVYCHEKSVEEVAGIVRIPENTVKTRLFCARKKLAELLKAAGVERGWP
jgi:RNA polymerase sigma-70 factor (ECF subfamily)